MNYNTNYPAFVLGLFETGLGVIRSLGRLGIPTFGFDYKKDVAFYSKYVKPIICPNPVQDEKKFINFILNFAKKFDNKPILYITADEFIPAILNNRNLINHNFLLNYSDNDLIEKISNKYELYKLAIKTNINVPTTIILEDIKKLNNNLKISFPVFLKGADSNSWRKIFGGSIKGFVFHNFEELEEWICSNNLNDISILIQEIIPGPDTNHYKFNVYIDKNGEIRAYFCLKKIRQNPVHFGVGCSVESVYNEHLIEIGKKLFKSIGYRGIGSAEFKYDDREDKFKLIEVNPRYWQQNSLATKCGVNFPLINYLDLTDQLKNYCFEFETGVKWINIYSDFDSFLTYRKESGLKLLSWLKSIKGKKVFSDWACDDIIPGFYEIKFGKKLIKLPKYLFKQLI